MKLLNLIFLLFFSLSLFAQIKKEQTKLSKNQLIFAAGFGYADGLISLSKRPSIGIGYERRLLKWLSLSTHILSYYENYSDFGYDDKVLDKFRGSNSPFFTNEEKEKLNNSGVKQLSPIKQIKGWSVPIDLGITVYPLSVRHHRLGLNAAFCMTYETHTFWKDSFTGTLKLADGTKEDILLTVPTEFRNLSPGFAAKIHYQYIFDKSSIGFRIGTCNVFFDVFGPNDPVWDTSLFYAYQF